jgi:hypothetical protein
MRGDIMDKKEAGALIRKAEEEIGQILKHLGFETTQYVEDVELRKENIGNHFNDSPKYLRHVVLRMCHPPGSNWR